MPGSDTTFVPIDLMHLGRPEAILTCLVPTGSGALLVDPGPASCREVLEQGLRDAGCGWGDLEAILLTHIHLDHAGATGTLLRLSPRLKAHVHRSGAAHLVDPAKLLGSAARLYGSEMERLWGEVLPVPADRLVLLDGGERLDFAGRPLEVAYTPGHAWHHVSYFDGGSGTAWVGDTAGLRTSNLPCVLPVTPPPDFDLEAWLASLDRIAAWRPDELVLTHFGPARDVGDHLARLREGLVSWAEYARASLDGEREDAARVREFIGRLEEWIEGKVPAERASRFLAGAGPEACWHGLARYWRKKAAAAPAAAG